MTVGATPTSIAPPPGQARGARINLGSLGLLSSSGWLDHAASPYAAYGGSRCSHACAFTSATKQATPHPLALAAIQTALEFLEQGCTQATNVFSPPETPTRGQPPWGSPGLGQSAFNSTSPRKIRAQQAFHRPAQNRTALTLSAPIAGSGNLILAARSPSAAASQRAQVQAQTRPARQKPIYRHSWLRTVTKSPAFALSSAAINGLMLVSPLVSLAETTTIYGTGSNPPNNVYTGGIINPGDTVILNDSATVSGSTPITANGTLQFNQTSNLTITNVLTGTGSLSLINTGNLTLTYNATVASIASVNAFDLGISIAGGSLLVGANGGNRLVIGSVSNGALTINGGTVKDTYGYLGLSNGSNGTATVSAGGNWTNTNELAIGYKGNGSLAVGGGNVSASNSIIGFQAGSNGTATISSGGWTNTGDLTVGQQGRGNLTLSGGTITNAAATIGYSTGGTGFATILGGNWTTTGNFIVGFSGNGSLAVSGGNISSASATLGIYGAGIAEISAGNWTNTANLTIGYYANGTLTISGGNVSNSNATIGVNGGSIGTVTVSGGNWTNSGNLTVGGSGTADLTISGGLVKVAGTLSKGANGTINLNEGGTLSIGNLSLANFSYGGVLSFNSSTNYAPTSNLSGTGSLIVQGSPSHTLTLSGNNTYTGGTTLGAGTLVLNSTNAIGTSGTITFSGGTLQSSATNTTDYSARFSAAASQAYAINTNSQAITWASNLTSSGGTLAKSGSGTLTLTGNNTYTGSTTIANQGGTLQIGAGGTSGSINASGTISLGSNTNLWFNRSDAITYGGVISSSGSLSQKGAGTLTLSGANTYIGDTNVTAGTLLVTGSLSDSSNVAVSSGATYQLGADDTIRMLAGAGAVNLGSYNLTSNSSYSPTFSGVMTGTGGLTKLGTGTLTLTGNNTYTGNTSINSGKLLVSGLLADNSNVAVATGATYQLGATDTIGSIAGDGTINLGNYNLTAGGTNASTSFSGVMVGNGAFTKAGTGTLSLLGSNTYNGGTTLAGGTLSLGSNQALGTTGAINFSGGSLQFTANNINDYSARFSQANNQAYAIDTNGQNISLASDLTSAGGTLTKAGTGTLTLLGSNTYTGGTTLAGGTLSLGSSQALGTAGTISFTGGSLQFTAINTIDYSARFSQASNQAYAIDTSDNVYMGLASDLTSVGGSLTKQGTGTLVLTGSNTYTGNTSILSGTLVVSGALADSTNVSVATGATYQVDETDTIGSIAGNGTINFNQRSLTAGGSNSTTTFSGVMLGEGAFTKAGTGTLTLSGNNTYTGDTILAGGTLSLGSNQALDTVGMLRFSGGSLQFTANNTTDYSARFSQDPGQAYAIDTNGQNISLATALTSDGGSLTKQGAGTLTLNGTNSYTGNTSIDSGTLLVSGLLADSSTISVATGATYQLGASDTIGSIAGNGTINIYGYNLTAGAANASTSFGGVLAGTGSFTKVGTGTLSLVGNNTYTGGTTLAGGTLSLGSNQALGTAGTISFTGGSLQFTASNTKDYSDRFSQDVDQAYVIDTNGQTISMATGLTSAGGSLTKQGTGTLTLTGNNTYTGATTIDAGTLRIGNGSGSASISNSSMGYLGFAPGSNGTASVSTGGTWTTTGDLYVGYEGNGNLTVSGGTVSNVNSVIGKMAGNDLDPTDPGYIARSNGTVTISGGNWTNTGSLNVGEQGTGTLTVSGGNVSSAYAGIGNDSAAIISGGNWRNSGNFDVSNQSNSSLTINGGLLTVGGTLTRGGSGKINLNEGGTLSIGGGGTNAKLNTNGNFTYNGTLIFNTTNVEAYQNSFSGSGSLIKEGSNTLTLLGNNTYTGATTINAGTLQIGNSSANASIGSASNIINNANLDFKSSNNQAYGGQISGSGTLRKSQGGTLILSGNNTYAGNTTIGAGTLQIGAGGTSGSLVSNVSGGPLVFNRSDSSTYGGVFSGSTLTKLGAGTLTLTGNNTNSGTTTISAGTLQIGAGGTTGAISNSPSIANNANLAFNRSDAASYGGAISGTGNLTQLGAGTLTLGGTNTYTGTTTISAGTLQIGAGGTGGAISNSSTITNNANLAFNRSNDYTYGGLISGGGSVAKLGAGTLTLSGINSYTGTTTVSTGTLQVQGSIAPSSGLTVNRGATLSGNGSITGTTINAGGILAPNNAGSSALAITGGSGTLSLASGSISNFSIISGNSDRVTASGSINLDGVLNLAFSGGNYLTSAPYTLFQGQSRSGTFSAANVNISGLSSAYQYALNYTATALNLQVFSVIPEGQSANITNPSSTTLSGGTLVINQPGSYNTSLVLTTPANANAASTIDGNGVTAELSGSISGNGSLAISNSQNSTTSSNTILTGNSTYTGTTTVEKGANLFVNGSIAASANLTVQAGASLGGNGILPLTTVQSGGTIAAGNSIGTLNINGNLTLNRGSSSRFEISNVSADRLSVTGSTALGGTVNLAFSGGTYDAVNPYTLVAAQSITTPFDAITTTGDLTGYRYNLTYSPTTVQLALAKVLDTGMTTSIANPWSTTLAGGTVSVDANGSFANNWTLATPSGSSVSTFQQSGQVATLAGSISGSGDLTIAANGKGGTLILAGNNSYTGTTTLSGGTVGLASPSALGTAGTINLTGASLLYGAGIITDYSNRFSDGANQAYSINTNGQLVTFASGLVSNGGTLTKAGEGTLILAANNSYSGATTIQAGTLQLGSGSNSGAISAASPIINQGTLAFKRSDATTYLGPISGSGSLAQLGSGSLSLSGLNSYSGATTIAGGSTLALVGSGSISDSSGVSNSGNFSIATATNPVSLKNLSGSGNTNLGNQTLTLTNASGLSSGVISGQGGALTINGSGTYGLSGTNTYTGATTIGTGETVQLLGSGSISSSRGVSNSGNLSIATATSPVALTNLSGSGTTNLGNQSLTITGATGVNSGVITGLGGSLAINGAGSYTLAGLNSYTGSTSVGGSTSLRLEGSIAPSSALTVTSGATLSGNGTLPATNIASGAILAPANAGSSALSIAGGSGNLNLASGSISNFSILATTSDRVAAAGTINLNGTLNLAFSADTYLTATPYVLFSGQSLRGSFGSVAVSGLSSSYVYSLDYGASALNLLVAASVPAGQSTDITSPTATTLSGGTILINEPGSYNTTLVLATPIGSATNTINGNGLTAVLSGTISGTGPITFINSLNSTTISDTILSGNNTYTGATVVDGGARLSVNGSIATSANLTVNAGAIVGGNGVLPATMIQSGGHLAPGNSIGLLTASSLSFGPVGLVDVEIQGPQNDKTVVTGTISNFTGTANLIAFGGGNPWPNFDYQLITAANTFATGSSLSLNPVGITSALLLQGTTLVQEADGNGQTFDVMWRPNNGIGAAASAMQALGQGNRNQLAAAGVFDSAFRRLALAAGNAPGGTSGLNATGSAIGSTGFTSGQAAAAGLSPEFLTTTSQLLGLTSTSQLTAAISTITPESYAAFQSVGLETLQRQRQQLLGSAGQCASNGWVINGPTSKTGKAPKNPICLYGQAANVNSSINGQGGLSSYNANLFSSFYGLEVKANPFWRLGAAYGYGTSNLGGLGISNAWVNATVNSGSLYGVYTPTPTSPWTFKGLVGYGNFALNGSRQVAVIGSGNAIRGSTTANGLTAALSAEVVIPLSKSSAPVPVWLKPLIGIAFGNYQQAGFSESGGGVLNLNIDGNSASSLVGTIGLELTTAPIALNQAQSISLVPRLALAYQVDALATETGNSSLSASMPASGSGFFLTQGQNRGVNGFSIAAGADLILSRSTALYANVNVEAFSSGSQVGYGGGLRFRF